MRMLRQIKRIRNKDIQNEVVTASTIYKMRNPILKWFGHVKRKSVDASEGEKLAWRASREVEKNQGSIGGGDQTRHGAS